MVAVAASPNPHFYLIHNYMSLMFGMTIIIGCNYNHNNTYLLALEWHTFGKDILHLCRSSDSMKLGQTMTKVFPFAFHANFTLDMHVEAGRQEILLSLDS